MPNWALTRLNFSGAPEVCAALLGDLIGPGDLNAFSSARDQARDKAQTSFDFPISFNHVTSMPEVITRTGGAMAEPGLAALSIVEGDDHMRTISEDRAALLDIFSTLTLEDSLKSFRIDRTLPEKELIADVEARYPGTMSAARTTLEAIRETGYKNWRSWSLDNWGTKWDAGEASFDTESDGIGVILSTAWAPPDKWLEAVVARHPGVCVEGYSMEPGNYFSVAFYGEDGDLSVGESSAPEAMAQAHLFITGDPMEDEPDDEDPDDNPYPGLDSP